MSRSNQTLLFVMALLVACCCAAPAVAETVTLDPWVEPTTTVPGGGGGGSSSGEPDVGQVSRTSGGSTTVPDERLANLSESIIWIKVLLSVRYLGISL